jgi:sugar diacid utilization regulator
VPTLRALVNRSELGLCFLAKGIAETSEVESALIVSHADLASWPDADVDVLQRVLLILPLSREAPSGQVEAAVRRIGGAGAAGVVLAPGSAGAGPSELEALAASARRHRIPLLITSGDPSRVWARTMTIIREEREHISGHAGDDLREMHRQATRPDGLERLLRWLARRVGGSVLLLDRAGVPLHTFPELPGDVLEQAAGEIERVVSGEVRAAAADLGAGVVHVQSIGEGEKSAVLVVARQERFSPPVRGLIRDASGLLALRWRVEDLSRRQRRVDRAETHTREAVLHLLMIGHLQAARRVAGALGPRLADEIRVYVMEGPADARDQSVAYCDRASGGRAWIVRCPVYTRHVIVLAPASNEAEEIEDALRAYAGRSIGIYVGGSDSVALRDLASGYAQAFHALAVARGNARHYARFSPRGDLTALLRPRGHEWAKATLEPLTGYRPHRTQDPDSVELTATLLSWLDFYGGAARQLKIHRNTLAARLRHIEQLLGRPLDDIETRSRLHLALRVLDGPGGDGGPVALDVLLDDPDVRRWADMQVSPLLRRDPELFMKTLRVWLNNDARLETTASALGISVPGTRKRLTRIEEILGRSLLSGPSARYEMWFALRVHDA